jgi:hypothetical protein
MYGARWAEKGKLLTHMGKLVVEKTITEVVVLLALSNLVL